MWCCRTELTCILKAETNCKRRHQTENEESVTCSLQQEWHLLSLYKYAYKYSPEQTLLNLSSPNKVCWSMKLTYRCLVTPPSHNGTGWHTHCHIWGQRHTGRTSHAWVHFCEGRASATVVHKWHEENLSFLPPDEKETQREGEREHSIITTGALSSILFSRQTDSGTFLKNVLSVEE